MPLIRGYARDYVTGAGIGSATVEVRRHDGDTLITQTSTDVSGLFSVIIAEYPGDVYVKIVKDGQTEIRSGRVSGQSGEVFLGDLHTILRVLGDGVIDNVDDKMVITSPSGLVTRRGVGAAIVLGHPAVFAGTLDLTHAANASGNPRIDTRILRLYRTGVSAGKIEDAILAGTPAVSPVPVLLTQTVATWEFALADIRIDNAASTIGADKITDRRAFATTTPRPKSVTRAMRKGVGRYTDYDPALVYAPDGFAGTGYSQGFGSTVFYFVRHTSRNAATLNRLQFEVTAAAATSGAVARVGVYAADSIDGRGRPLTLLADGNTASITTAGVRLVSGISLPMSEETTYWLAIAFTDTVSFRAQSALSTNTGYPHILGSPATSNSEYAIVCFAVGTPAGIAVNGLPATLSGLTVNNGNANAPFIWVGVA